MQKPSLIQVATRPALHLPELDLFLDPHRSNPFAFISHAHADHFARHDRILCSPVTGHLLHKRFRVAASRIETIAYDDVLTIDGFEIRLLPAGHIFGSAMIHVTRQQDGSSVLYTGDYKLRPSLTSEPTQLRPADILIMETTFGKPHFVFPKREKIEADILQFVRSALEDGEQPVLLGYSLGKAQEALAILHEAGVPAVAHKTVHAMSQACHEAGSRYPAPPVFEGTIPPGHVLVAPPNAVRSKQLRTLKKRQVAMLSGWALTPGAQYRYQTDAAFPLSDHADYEELLETVSKVTPQQVLTLHGSTREFARDLRERGYEAWSIYGDDQIELGLQTSSPTPDTPPPKKETNPRTTEFTALAQVVTTVAAQPARLRKISGLAQHLQTLDEAALALTVNYLSERLLGKRQALTLGTAVIRQALLEATKAPLASYRQTSNLTADSARTARLLLEQYPTSSAAPLELNKLSHFAQLFQDLSQTSGSLQKTNLLAQAFASLSPEEAEFLVRLLTGGLRAGLKTALLEDAIAEAFQSEADPVRRAHMLLGDLAKTALLAKTNQLTEASLQAHSPLAPMLASPEPEAASLFQRLQEKAPIPLEPKHDGIRAQLHHSAEQTSLFSRDLRSLNDEFPELVEAAKILPPCILDGELIAYAEGRQLNFFDLQKRLGRKRHQGDLFLGEAIPVRFVAFDILFHKGQDLLEEPYRARRELLEKLKWQEPFQLIPQHQAMSISEIDEHFKTSLKAGHEGLIAKDPDSIYSPGRRGKSWLKLKGVMPTLDCVVIAAQQGHGRRAEVLSDYTFAVRDERTGTLATLGKAYSGLTDEEIEDLTEHFKKTTLEKKRRVHWVEPTTVLEIAFDSINPSKRHNSGLALRFPRIKAIRHDKTPADIDTLATAKSLLK